MMLLIINYVSYVRILVTLARRLVLSASVVFQRGLYLEMCVIVIVDYLMMVLILTLCVKHASIYVILAQTVLPV